MNVICKFYESPKGLGVKKEKQGDHLFVFFLAQILDLECLI